ncbi:MAG: TolC family protein [Bryobacteraceae bacterium]|nr:TolC family protein [Bryobacteraceae bacterium]
MTLAVWVCFVAVPLAAAPPLSLREAVAEALARHPVLAAGAERVRASEALRLQAALRPNPRLFIQLENLRAYGAPGFSYGRDADSYLYVSQVFETGAKRERRVEAAAVTLRRAELERELLRRQIAARVKQAYWAAAGAQRQLEILLETGQTFRQVVEYHELRVREGAMAEADLLRVRLEGERLAIAANGAALEAERTRIQLFREMGRTEFPPVDFADPLEDPAPAPVVVDVAAALESRPEMQLARLAVEQARANLRLAEAHSRPDLDVLFGYKRTAGFNTLLGGVQWNLPVLNRNQGNIAAALAEVRAAESSLAATEALIRAEVRTAAVEYEARRRQLAESLRALREHAAESARIAQAAYREGGTDLLRLLDAERVRLETETLYYRTLAEYRQSAAALEAALGVEP